ncbi:hypothetical protein VTK26DRAFT_1412 [Humicola hyalothermophila]
MTVVYVPLPETHGKEALMVSTSEHCVARVAADGVDERGEVFEGVKASCTAARAWLDSVDTWLQSLETAANGSWEAEIVKVFQQPPENQLHKVHNEFRALEDRESAARGRAEKAATVEMLYGIAIDAAARAASAAYTAYQEALSLVSEHPGLGGNSEALNSRIKRLRTVHDTADQTIKQAENTQQWYEKLGDDYQRNNNKMVLVVGGGVSGLMTAWFLLDKGYRVSIVAKEWRERKEHERMTSQIAGALWEYPPGGCGLSEIEVPVLAYSKLGQYRKWALQSFAFYRQLACSRPSAEFGARMITLYQFFHHNHAESTGDGGDPTGDDATARRVRESARDHHNKWQAIKTLDQEPGDLHANFRAEECDLSGDIPLADSMAGWREALNAVRCESFGLNWAYRHQAPVVDTDTAMGFLMDVVRRKRATLETRNIKQDLHLQERELMDDFGADIIVNASGLGARVLANDSQIFPVRGAVRRMKFTRRKNAAKVPGHEEASAFLESNAVLLPAQYDQKKQPSKTVFIVPRNSETIVVGSIIQRNNWDLGLTTTSPEVEAMWERATKLVEALSTRDEDERPLAQGLRPFSHSNVRVSADNRTTACRVVHNYGHGGSGWTLAVGCALTCIELVGKILHESKSGSLANAEVWRLDQP